MYILNNLSAIILAAGQGKRMKSKYAKVMQKISEKPMIEWVCDAVKGAEIEESIVVVGYRAEDVKSYLGDKVKYAFQEKLIGTGNAVLEAEKYLSSHEGYTVVLCGDVPLISEETIKEVADYHIKNGFAQTVITGYFENPDPLYGRIVRGTEGNVIKIVEFKDATEEERKIKEVNSGLYFYTTKHLFEALKEVNNNNAQGEYYLTDTVEILINKGYTVGAIKVDDNDEITGINSRKQLAQAQMIVNQKILNKHMDQGVTIIDPNNTYISADTLIGMDTVIYPGTIIEGNTLIGEDCVIGPNVRITDSNILNGVSIQNSVITESKIGENTKVGPFAYIRPESIIGENVKIGDFVEIKKSTIGNGTKVPHLTYVGDAQIGDGVNLGCGTIVVNYDGKEKHKTTIEDGVFVGCNSNLVSPVILRKNSYVGAGSTITDEVPENALAIARCKQTNIKDWVLKKKIK